MKKVLLLFIVLAISLKTNAQTISYQNSPIIEHADTMPEYKGGMDSFYSKLSRIRY